LRIGLNSGRIIAGGIGPGSLGLVGQQVGIAQRMESVAAPGGVMLSASSARLVENAAVLGKPQLVQIDGAHAPMPARRLLGVASQPVLCEAGAGQTDLTNCLDFGDFNRNAPEGQQLQSGRRARHLDMALPA
jgi:class 3 adenylate cyclase